MKCYLGNDFFRDRVMHLYISNKFVYLMRTLPLNMCSIVKNWRSAGCVVILFLSLHHSIFKIEYILGI